MPKAARKAGRSTRKTVRSKRKGSTWVRKNMLMDQRKLDEVRRLLKVSSETEAVDTALSEIAFGRQLKRGLDALSRSGGLDDVFEER
jgi:hypothetical protein